jgi:hypothetical protein
MASVAITTPVNAGWRAVGGGITRCHGNPPQLLM